MNVEHSAVRYTLTMRSYLGEEVVAHGQLPNNPMDEFMMINQYVTNPEKEKKTSEQSVQTCLEQSVQEHIITDLVDFITQGQLHHSQSDVKVPHSAETQSLIASSMPQNVVEETNGKEIQQEQPVYTHEEWLIRENIGQDQQKKVNLFFDMVSTFYPAIPFLTIRTYYLLYQAWRRLGTHPNLNRWKAMQFWMRTMRPDDK
jgi:hypothetical protein